MLLPCANYFFIVKLKKTTIIFVMKKKMTLKSSESLQFNYHDISFSYYFNNERSCTHFVLKMPSSIDLAVVAPLLCAGITT